MYQFFRRGLLPSGIPSSPAILDPHVPAIGPAQPLERIEERRDAGLTLTVGLRVKRQSRPTRPSPSSRLRTTPTASTITAGICDQRNRVQGSSCTAVIPTAN